MKKYNKILLAVAAIVVIVTNIFSSIALANDGRVLHVAIIGDSYSAGNGAGNYYHIPKSFRSHRSWGNLYINWLKSQGVNAISHNFAYSGSTTSDVILSVKSEKNTANDDQKDKPIERFPNNIGLVLMTAGGNDAKFATIVEKCFAPIGSNENQCRQSIDNANGLINNNTIKNQTFAIFSELQKRILPSAEVIMLGYPLLSPPNVHTFKGKFNASNKVRELGLKADNHQKKFVEEWNSNNRMKVRFVSTHNAFAGHEPKGIFFQENPVRWINGFGETEGEIKNGKTKTKFSTEIANFYHPNITGHEKMMGLVRQSTKDNRPKLAYHQLNNPEIDRIISNYNIHKKPEFFVSGKINKSKIFDVAEIISQTIKKYYSSRSEFTIRMPICNQEDPKSGSEMIQISSLKSKMSPSNTFDSVYAALYNLSSQSEDKLCVKKTSDYPPLEISTYYTTKDFKNSIYRDLLIIPFYGWSDDMDSDGLFIQNSSAPKSGSFRRTPDEDEYPDVFAHLEQVPILEVGEKFTFDGRSSYTKYGKIVKYEWDFDGDGIFELTSTQPMVERSFNKTHSGKINLRVTNKYGQSKTTSTHLEVVPPTDPEEEDRKHAEYIESLTAKEVPIDGELIPREEIGKYIYEKYGSIEGYLKSIPPGAAKTFNSGRPLIDIYRKDVEAYAEKVKNSKNPDGKIATQTTNKPNSNTSNPNSNQPPAENQQSDQKEKGASEAQNSTKSDLIKSEDPAKNNQPNHKNQAEKQSPNITIILIFSGIAAIIIGGIIFVIKKLRK